MAAKIKKISKLQKSSEERQIILAMVVDTIFLRQLQPSIRLEFFKAPFARTVAQWCLDYWELSEEAPRSQIQEIFETKERKEELDEDTLELIRDFLSSLSQEYEKEDRPTEFYIKNAEKYFRRRALEILNEDTSRYAASGDIDSAEQLVAQFRRPSRDEGGWVNPFQDKEAIFQAFNQTAEPLFKLPGPAGELLNDLFVREGFVAFLAPEKRGKCLCGQTPVLLSDGRVKPISEVVRDKDLEIMSLDERMMKIVPMKIYDYWANGKKPCVTVKTRTGRIITTTKNHPYLTPMGWRPVLELAIGDRIAVPRNIACFGNKTEAEEKIKLLALMIAEGGLTDNSCPSFTSSYSDVQEMFFRCVEHMGDGISRSSSDPITFSVINHISKKGKHNSNSTISWLKSLDLMGKKSKEKKIPSLIFELQKEQLALFLNILFSCDGSVYQKGIEYSSASESMIRQVSHLLLRFGIIGTVRNCIVKSKTYWSFGIRDRDNLLKFIDEIGFSFHKKQKANELLATLKKQSRSNCFIDSIPPEICDKIWEEMLGRNKGGQKEALRAACANRNNLSRNSVAELSDCGSMEADKAANGDILWDAIVEIVDAGEIETYDLSVPEHHNFIAGDIVAHNTWWLMYFSLMASKRNLNIAFFSVGDMSRDNMLVRYGIMQTRRSNREKYCGELLIPVIDCFKNQNGLCDLPERENTIDVIRGEAILDFYHPEAKGYKPCDYCRRDKERKPLFMPAIWRKVRPPVSPLGWGESYRKGQSFAKLNQGSSQFRLSVHSNTSINVTQIDAILKTWQAQDEFIPDVVLLDYADILAPEDVRKSERGQENDRWKALRRLSQEWNCLLLTATQADANSYQKDTLDETNFSEDKRKYSHVTGIITLNQTRQEKQLGVIRLGTMFLREDGFDYDRTVSVLQSIPTGQIVLKSFFTKDGVTPKEIIKEDCDETYD